MTERKGHIRERVGIPMWIGDCETVLAFVYISHYSCARIGVMVVGTNKGPLHNESHAICVLRL
jgi:hypothetical protein